MKKMNMVCIAAATVVLSLALVVGCSDGGGGSSVPGLPGGVKSAKDLKSHENDFVTSQTNARTLFNKAVAIVYGLQNADEELWEEAFKKKYEMDHEAYFTANLLKKSLSYSVDIDDSKALPVTSTGSSWSSTTYTYNDTKVAIKGNSSQSWSSNITLAEFYMENGKEGDSVSSSTSGNRSYTFNDDFVSWTASGATIKVAGFITIEYNSSDKNTLKKLGKDDVSSDQYEADSNDKQKVSLVLTVSDGTNGAKFRFSWATEDKYKARSIESSGGSNKSNLEVYNNSNELIYTINDYNYSSWSNAIEL